MHAWFAGGGGGCAVRCGLVWLQSKLWARSHFFVDPRFFSPLAVRLFSGDDVNLSYAEGLRILKPALFETDPVLTHLERLEQGKCATSMEN